MRVLICGSRNWMNRQRIFDAIHDLPRDTVVIHGGARGVDSVAGQYAKYLGMEVVEYPADWDTHGKAAGPIRNQQMIDEGKPDKVIAFRYGQTSRGTDDMIRRARAAGLDVKVHTDGPRIFVKQEDGSIT